MINILSKVAEKIFHHQEELTREYNEDLLEHLISADKIAYSKQKQNTRFWSRKKQ